MAHKEGNRQGSQRREHKGSQRNDGTDRAHKEENRQAHALRCWPIDLNSKRNIHFTTVYMSALKAALWNYNTRLLRLC